jgi:hypothetical protein
VDFVLSSDLDWASEYCIENFLSIADQFSIKPTIYVTHKSPALQHALKHDRVEVGIHPNFFQPSSHGKTTDEIIAHVTKLAPRAKSVRCHRHLSSVEIENALVRSGITVDSNTYGHLQRGIRPSRLASGLLRFPVFFEDDLHWMKADMSWKFSDYQPAFFEPGLKILNFHPFLVALNAPAADFYLRHKHHIQTLSATEAEELRYKGSGAATFLTEAIAAIQSSGHRFVTLSELATKHRDELKLSEGIS